MFPEPLHLTRRVDDPISDTSSTVEEYCLGNRVITVRGQQVAITDYERQTITQIDRAASTYSIIKFSELAEARKPSRSLSRTVSAAPVSLGVRAGEDGHSIDAYQVKAESLAEKPTLEIGVDRSVALSREALEVLVGAAYPNERMWNHDAIEKAAASPRSRMQSTSTETVAAFGLPADQSLRWEADGKTMVMRNVVTNVDRKPPPPEVMMIPPGARLIESPTLVTKRLLDELEARKPKD